MPLETLPQHYSLSADGERFLPWVGDDWTGYEHIHRYLLAGHYVHNKRVVDVACGEGYGTALLATVASSVIGIDINEATVAHATAHHQRPNTTFMQGRAENLPVPLASVDVVVSFETLEHFTEHEQFMHAVKSALTDAGILLLSTPNRQVYTDEVSGHNPFHQRELYYSEFVALCQQHFAYVQVVGQNLFVGSLVGLATNHNTFGEPSGQYSTDMTTFTDDMLDFSTATANTMKPRYYIAICSDQPLPPIPASLMLDTNNRLLTRIAERDPGHIERVVKGWAEMKAAVDTHVVHLDAHIDELVERDKMRANKISELEQEKSAVDAHVLQLDDHINELVERDTMRARKIQELEQEKGLVDAHVLRLDAEILHLQRVIEQLKNNG